MRLIDADALIKKLKSNSWDIDEWELPHEQVTAGLMANAYDRETVEEMPTVDAVPVRHGKWELIRMEDNGDGFYTCSNCDRGDIHSPLVTVPYCWYCGARMDAERKEE